MVEDLLGGPQETVEFVDPGAGVDVDVLLDAVRKDAAQGGDDGVGDGGEPVAHGVGGDLAGGVVGQEELAGFAPDAAPLVLHRAEERSKGDGVGVAAVDADVVDGNDRCPHLAGNHTFGLREPCEVVGAPLGVGDDEGGGVRAAAGAAGAPAAGPFAQCPVRTRPSRKRTAVTIAHRCG
ncbi:hypothetical protein [Streptomyces sp. NPDC047009]|uniref:hypothetical protein n=1 Tax=unclassified Streptomyces TaxID=2593676 RepID=UPI0033D19B03